VHKLLFGMVDADVPSPVFDLSKSSVYLSAEVARIDAPKAQRERDVVPPPGERGLGRGLSPP